MPEQHNKENALRGFAELFSQGRLELAEELVSADFVNYDAPLHAARGPEGVRAQVELLRAAFPDLHIEVEDIVAEGDLVAVRATLYGTHQGAFMGIAPTGRHGAPVVSTSTRPRSSISRRAPQPGQKQYASA